MIGGGHTVTDPEPKYGLCVTGLADPHQIMSKGNARPGDRLVLTKPVGTGVITTAAKNDRAAPSHLQAAVDWMLRLNGPASRVLRWAGVRACTDITGFGLLGHASEMAEAETEAEALWEALEAVEGPEALLIRAEARWTVRELLEVA